MLTSLAPESCARSLRTFLAQVSDIHLRVTPIIAAFCGPAA